MGTVLEVAGAHATFFSFTGFPTRDLLYLRLHSGQLEGVVVIGGRVGSLSAKAGQLMPG